MRPAGFGHGLGDLTSEAKLLGVGHDGFFVEAAPVNSGHPVAHCRRGPFIEPSKLPPRHTADLLTRPLGARGTAESFSGAAAGTGAAGPTAKQAR